MRWIITLLLPVLLAGCAAGTMMGAGQGGQAADGRSYEAARADNLISAAINRLLVKSQEVRSENIRVATRDGVATLSGRVETAAMAARAEQLARGVDGVKGVVNQLQVGQ